MTFTQQAWESYAEGPLATYRESYRRHHAGAEAPPPLTGDLMYCHPDPAVAEERGLEYMTRYFLTIVKHYELMGDHFARVGGYDSYQEASEAFRKVGMEVAARAYCSFNLFGTPEQMIEKLARRREVIGDFELGLISSYGGMSQAEAEASIRLFGEKVLPALADV